MQRSNQIIQATMTFKVDNEVAVRLLWRCMHAIELFNQFSYTNDVVFHTQDEDKGLKVYGFRISSLLLFDRCLQFSRFSIFMEINSDLRSNRRIVKQAVTMMEKSKTWPSATATICALEYSVREYTIYHLSLIYLYEYRVHVYIHFMLLPFGLYYFGRRNCLIPIQTQSIFRMKYCVIIHR